MTRARSLKLLFLTLAVTGLALPELLAATESEPDDALARLNYSAFRTTRQCTAVLTAPDHAVTAAHCIDGIPSRSVNLLRGYDRGEWLEHLRPTGTVPDDASRDVVTLCIERDDSRPFIPLAKRPVEVGETVTVLGYGRPRIHALSRKICRISETKANAAFVLDCPVSEGDSGAPVLRSNGSGYEVVGVVSASSRTASLVYVPGAAHPCTGNDQR